MSQVEMRQVEADLPINNGDLENDLAILLSTDSVALNVKKELRNASRKELSVNLSTIENSSLGRAIKTALAALEPDIIVLCGPIWTHSHDGDGPTLRSLAFTKYGWRITQDYVRLTDGQQSNHYDGFRRLNGRHLGKLLEQGISLPQVCQQLQTVAKQLIGSVKSKTSEVTVEINRLEIPEKFDF